MNNKDFRMIRNNIGTYISPSSLLAQNRSFLNSILKRKSSIGYLIDGDGGYETNRELVYSVASSGIDPQVLQAIIDLLLQLRASQSDQNVFVQNNTVVRQQILNQLQNEVLKAQGALSREQVQKFEVISSNTFDENTLNDLLNSLLGKAKKKLADLGSNEKSLVDKDGKSETVVIQRPDKKYFNILNNVKRYNVISSNINDNLLSERIIHRKNLVNRQVIKDDIQEVNQVDISQREQLGAKVSKTEIHRERIIEDLGKIYEERIINKIDLTPRITKILSRHKEILSVPVQKEFVSEIWRKIHSVYRVPEENVTKNIAFHEELKEDYNKHINKKNRYIYDRTSYSNQTDTIYNEIQNYYNDHKSFIKNIRTLQTNESNRLEKLSIAERYNKILTTVLKTDRLISRDAVPATIVNRSVSQVTQKEEEASVQNRMEINQLQTEFVRRFLNKSINLKNIFEERLSRYETDESVLNLYNRKISKISEKFSARKTVYKTDTQKEHVNVDLAKDTVSEQHTQRTRNLIEKQEIKVRTKSISGYEDVQQRILSSEELHKTIVNKYKKLTLKRINKPSSERVIYKTDLIDREIVKSLESDTFESETTNIKETLRYNQTNIINKEKTKNKRFINVKSVNNIIDRYNKLEETVVNNASESRLLEKVDLISKQTINNELLEKEELETVKSNIKNIQTRLLKQSSDKVIDSKSVSEKRTTDLRVSKDIIRRYNSLILDVVNKRYEENITRDKILNYKNVINDKIFKNYYSNVNNVEEKIPQKQIEKRLIKDYNSNIAKSSGTSGKRLDVFRKLPDIINRSEKTIFDVVNRSDTQRIFERETLVNRNVLTEERIEERESQRESVKENIIDKAIKRVYKDSVVNKDIERLSKSIKNDISIVNRKSLSEKVQSIVEKTINNLSVMNIIKDGGKIIEKKYSAPLEKYIEKVFTKTSAPIKDNISKTQDANRLITRRTLNILSPEITRINSTDIIERDIYRDINYNKRSYYNDMTENIGRSFIVREPEVIERENRNLNVVKSEMIYKTPILKLDEIEEIKKIKDEPKKKDARREKQYEDINIKTKDVVKNPYAKAMDKQKALNERDIKRIVEGYMSSVNIESISRVVINRVEEKIRLDRMRNGMI